MASGQPKDSVALLILTKSAEDSPELQVLKDLPSRVKVVGIGKTLEDLQHLSEGDWASVDVLLNCGVGPLAASRADLQLLLPRLPGLRWMHSVSAGLEHLLCPELVDSPLLLTNAKGVYSNALAEWVMFACSYFAKDLPRMLKAQADKRWEQYDVEELRGKTLGVIGYGDIGQASARLAQAYGMRVVACRRRTELSEAEAAEGLLQQLFSPQQLPELMACSDYVVMATPYTPATHQMVGAAALAAMKPSAVFINVGRGKCVDEEALVEVLQQGRIRGAALDVYAVEPLPGSSPLWGLANTLVSAHTADRTKDFQVQSLLQFKRNLERYLEGQELINLCDKRAGY